MMKPRAYCSQGAAGTDSLKTGKASVYSWLFFVVCFYTGCTTMGQTVVNKDGVKTLAFTRQVLTDQFIAEGVAVGDVNKDGLIDVLAGAFWFEAPGWKQHEIMKPEKFEYDKGYSDAFISQAMDVNFDGWTDFLRIGFPGKEAYWFENPQGKSGHWKKHLIHDAVGNESAGFYDVDGDGRLDLLGGNASKKQMTWFKAPSSAGNLEWQPFPISPEGNLGSEPFSHGLGMGDMNGDGRRDVIITKGWWEAPKDVHQPGWVFHEANLGQAAAQMYAHDFDGDGDQDVVSSSAHGLGIWWHEQVTEKGGGEARWTTHQISNAFTQTHGLVLTDMNKDGSPDLVTGKRYFAHMGRDPGEFEPPVLYWFELKKGSTPAWVPHLIDNSSGVGVQVVVEDINGDGLKDIISANKKGVFVFKLNGN
ncbi:MAG TPA: VCBS repeat-containing protein [Chitinophagaceae bacterium]|nr:VCBS repeat-containing protein [Chitinophagaceae bacterium]